MTSLTYTVSTFEKVFEPWYEGCPRKSCTFRIFQTLLRIKIKSSMDRYKINFKLINVNNWSICLNVNFLWSDIQCRMCVCGATHNCIRKLDTVFICFRYTSIKLTIINKFFSINGKHDINILIRSRVWISKVLFKRERNFWFCEGYFEKSQKHDVRNRCGARHIFCRCFLFFFIIGTCNMLRTQIHNHKQLITWSFCTNTDFSVYTKLVSVQWFKVSLLYFRM